MPWGRTHRHTDTHIHTHTDTHTHIHTQAHILMCKTKAISRNHAGTWATGPCAWFKNAKHV